MEEQNIHGSKLGCQGQTGEKIQFLETSAVKQVDLDRFCASLYI